MALKYPDPDGLDAHTLIRDLKSIQVKQVKDKNYVVACEQVRKNVGILPPEAMTRLRKIYKNHGAALNALYEMRDRAREGQAKEIHGEAVVNNLSKSPDDFGL